jgi:aspartate-semialdehyde dehydrogenase
MKTYNVGIIGATGMVGQRFISLLEGHPWFKIKALAASSRSAGKSYGEAAAGRWMMAKPVPEAVKGIVISDAEADAERLASAVDFVFCAVDMPKDQIRALEERYAKLECPVISNNSANRSVPDVPMIIPEINGAHSGVIPYQRRRLGTKRGFIAVKSNCSIQSYVPALHPLWDLGIRNVLVCTYQAISGAGKTFVSWPEMADNVIPFIGGEEEKSEREPLKIWGELRDGGIVEAEGLNITAQCIRVPVSDGHLAAVFASFEKKISLDEIKRRWADFQGGTYGLNLPSAPGRLIHYFEEEDRPQVRLDRDIENAMAVSVGRLRPDTQYDIKFVCISHNTVRGAAGGGILMAEMLCAQGYL